VLKKDDRLIIISFLKIILLGIVWNAFCNAFSGGLGLGLSHSLVLLTLLPVLHLVSLGVLFKLFSQPFLKFSRGETVAAMFCSSQKTLAFGLPLINTIFEGSPNLASYCAPLMFIHPLQMTLGSLLLPMITKYTSGEALNGEQRD
jgi:sodium/bile acid cotransporter 7